MGHVHVKDADGVVLASDDDVQLSHSRSERAEIYRNMVEEVIAATAKPGDYDHITESADALGDDEIENEGEDDNDLETCAWTPSKENDGEPSESLASNDGAADSMMVDGQEKDVSAANIPTALAVDADLSSTKSVEEATGTE